MIGIIDRFEGDFAIIELENKTIINVERGNIPLEAKEGYVINLDNVITINFKETKKRKRLINELTDDIWK